MKKRVYIIFCILILLGASFAPQFVAVVNAQQEGDFLNQVGGSCPADGTVTQLTFSGWKCQITDLEDYNVWKTANPAIAAENEQTLTTDQQERAPVEDSWLSWLNPAKWVKGLMTAAIAPLLLRVGAFALIIGGNLFDWVLQHTVVNMAADLSDDNGIGGSINDTWTVIRDMGNILFIFVLLWAAIQTILDIGGDLGKTIRNIIIVGLLINFSLFFSKVVIDASNIATVGFYNSIIAASENQDVSIVRVEGIGGGVGTQKFGQVGGFTSIFMRAVGLQSFFGDDVLKYFQAGGNDFGSVTIMAFMGTITMLIMAMIFLILSVMFVARYVLLIFLMILSPIALVGYAIPALSGRFKEWWDSLISQAFFAPYFMILMWVVMKIISTPNFLSQDVLINQQWANVAHDPKGVMGLLLNYVLVLGFIVAAMVLSKQMATKMKGFTAITAGVGAVTAGSLGFVARQTVGRYATSVADNKDLQERAASGDKGARMQLATAKKFAGSSFDFRGVADTGVGKVLKADQMLDVLGTASGKGGFKAKADAKSDKKKKEIDEVMRNFRDKPGVIAQHLMTRSPSDQEYMYDKLSARDRAALEDKLDALPGGSAVKTRLRAGLSDDEREKTDKAAKDATRDAVNKALRDNIQKLVTGAPADTNPATGAPFTYDDIFGTGGTLPTGWRPFRSNEARKLSNEALQEDEVIKRLSARHLADITSDKDDLDDTTKRYIISVIQMAPPYSLQTEQDNYVNSTTTIKSFWGI